MINRGSNITSDACSSLIMDALDCEGLSRVLEQHKVPSDIINLLKAQKVTGQDFMSLTDQELITFQFPLGYVKTINRVKSILSERPLSYSETLSQQSDPKKYSALIPYFTQRELNSYSDYEKDAFLNRLERHKAVFGDEGNPFQQLKGNPPKKRKVSDTDSLKPISTTKPLSDINVGASTSGAGNLKPTERSRASADRNKGRTSLHRDDDSENFSDETTSCSDNEKDDSDVNNDKDNEPSDNDDSDKENESTSDFLKTKLTSFLKNQKSLQELKPHIAILDVNEILEKDKETKKFVPHLKDGWLLVEKSRKRVYRVLMNYICWKYKKHPNEVTMATREMLAKSIVVAYPQYQRPFEIKGKDPWSPVLLNLNNIMKRIQDKLPTEERSRKGQRKTPKTKKLPTNSTVNASVGIQALAVLNPDRNNTQTIMDGMAATFAIRCNMRRDGESITVILEKFPQFQHYKGNVLSEEFSRIYPNAEDMCPQLLELCPKILELCRNKITFEIPFEDDLLTACLALAFYLPHPVDPPPQGPRASGNRRQRKRKGRNQESVSCATPQIDELIVIKPPNVDIPVYVQERRAEMENMLISKLSLVFVP
ncbi:Halomucin [Frankliniella fusca]|uniref:Halomucin n=1 Tax=Frankliniella fusca TaxID=407009 RepID=A0AAE1HPJ2_9NEOP|nr:Halomucin [Frankliniella fusca]